MTQREFVNPAPAPEEPTIGRLVADASRDLSALVQNEIALAKSELKVSVKAGGLGLGLVGAALFVLLIVMVLVPITLAYFLTMTGMHAAWAFLIVTVLYLVIAGLLGFVAYAKFKKVRAPEKTLQTAKSIPDAFRGPHPTR